MRSRASNQKQRRTQCIRCKNRLLRNQFSFKHGKRLQHLPVFGNRGRCRKENVESIPLGLFVGPQERIVRFDTVVGIEKDYILPGGDIQAGIARNPCPLMRLTDKLYARIEFLEHLKNVQRTIDRTIINADNLDMGKPGRFQHAHKTFLQVGLGVKDRNNHRYVDITNLSETIALIQRHMEVRQLALGLGRQRIQRNSIKHS